MTACKRQVSVTSAPSSQPTAASANPNATGGATHREALTRFMQAAKVQDVQAMSNAWGTSKGAVRTDRSFMTVDEMEKRIVIMLRCLRHDSYSVLNETQAIGGERIFQVQIKFKSLTAVSDFTTTPGPESRFYVRTLDFEKLQAICGAN
jgi:hypothetical protein